MFFNSFNDIKYSISCFKERCLVVPRLLILFLLIHSMFAAGAASKSGKLVNKKSETELAVIEQVSSDFAEALEQRDEDAAFALIDTKELAKRVIDLAFKEKDYNQVDEFAKGFEVGFKNNTFKSWFDELDRSEGYVSYRRVISVNGQRRGVVLLDFGDSGLNFIELIVDVKLAKIIDFYMYTSGEMISETSASLIAMMMPEKTSFFNKLLGRVEFDNSLVKTIKETVKAQRNGDFKGAYNRLLQLPEEFQNQRFIMIMKVSLSNYVSEEEYRKQLVSLEKQYGSDPELFFLLFDHLFFTKQYEKSLNGLSRLEERLQKDSALSNLKAVIYLSDNQLEKSIKASEESISLDPEIENYYWFKISLLNKAKRFKSVVETLEVIEKKFNLIFDPDAYKKDKEYSEFIQSKAFKTWREKWVIE